MPKFTPVVSKSLFKEKSLDEYLKPYLLAKAEYEKDKAARDAEIEGIAKFDPYLNEDTKEANAISAQTKNYIQNAVDWMGTPYYHANRSSLLAAKKKYQDNSNVLLGGATGFTDFQKTQADLNAKDPTRRTGLYRPDGTFTEKPNIDDFLHNKNLTVYDMSGEQVRTDWQKYGAALSGRFSWTRSDIGGNILTRYNPQTREYEAMTDADGNPIQILVSTNEKQHGINGQITIHDLITGFANWTEDEKKKFLTNQPELRELFENDDIPRMWNELHNNDMFLHLKPEDQQYMEERAMTGLLQGLNLYDEQRSTSASFVPTSGRGGSGSGSGLLIGPENQRVSRSTGADKRDKWDYQDTLIQAVDITEENPRGDVKTAEQVKAESALRPIYDMVPEMLQEIQQGVASDPEKAKKLSKELIREAHVQAAAEVAKRAKELGLDPLVESKQKQKLIKEEMKKILGVSVADDILNDDGTIDNDTFDSMVEKIDTTQMLKKLINKINADSITTGSMFVPFGLSLMTFVKGLRKLSLEANGNDYGLSSETMNKLKETIGQIESAGVSVDDLLNIRKTEAVKSQAIKEASQYMPGETTYEQAANYQQLRKIRSDSQVYRYDPTRLATPEVRKNWQDMAKSLFSFNTDGTKDMLHANSGVFMPDGTQIKQESDDMVDLGKIKVKAKDFFSEGEVQMEPFSPTGWVNLYKGVAYPMKTDNDVYRETGKFIHDAVAALENTDFNKDNTLVLKTGDRMATDGFDDKIEFIKRASEEAQNIMAATNISVEAKQKELEALSKKYEENYKELIDKNGKYGKYMRMIGEPNSITSGYACNICTEDPNGNKQIEILLFTKDFRSMIMYNPMEDLSGNGLSDFERDAVTYGYNTIALRAGFKFDLAK